MRNITVTLYAAWQLATSLHLHFQPSHVRQKAALLLRLGGTWESEVSGSDRQMLAKVFGLSMHSWIAS